MSWLSSNLYRHLVTAARSSAMEIHGCNRDTAERVLERLRSRHYLIGEASH